MNTSIWVDYLDREFLDTTFKQWVNGGVVNGLTSNPAIFANALKKEIYKEDIEKLKGKSSKEIYEEIAVKDIQKACDILEPLYDEGDDGYASIEVDPRLISDTKGTVDEALRLVDKIARENLMIKYRKRRQAINAIEELVKEVLMLTATLGVSPKSGYASRTGYRKGPRSVDGVVSGFVAGR